MKKRIKFIFKIHSWIGLFIGLFLLIISVSGSILVFYEEVDLLLNYEILEVKPEKNKVSLNHIYTNIKERFPSATTIRFRHLPKEASHSIEVNVIQEGKNLLVYADPYTGKIIGERERFTFLVDWLLRLHYTLFAGTIGEIIVALLGILLLVSLLTGLVVYRKYILKVIMFQVPLRFKNWKTASSEIHRIIGVWSLVFNLIIATTGFYIIYTILSRPKPQVIEKIKEEPVALNISLDGLIRKTNQVLEGFVPYAINIPSNDKDPIKITGGIPDVNPLSPAYSSYISFNPTTAEVMEVFDIRKKSFLIQLDKSIYSLHFGNFGGLIIKILYSLLGITPSFLAITGFLLWWRRNGKKRSVPVERLINKKGKKSRTVEAFN